MSIAIRHLGTCPVCEGKFKARTQDDTKLTMVHHGYRRPGHGSIVGDCFAVGYEPYELSDKGCRDYQAMCQGSLEECHDYLARLHAKPEQMSDYVNVYYEIASRRPVGGTVVYRRDNPDEAVKYEYLRSDAVRATQYRIQQLEQEIGRMNGLITSWTLREVEAWSEEIEAERKKAERAARAAVLDAKRAARKDINDAKKAKQDALKAKRQVIKDNFASRLRALATSPEALDERRQAAVLIFRELRMQKYRWLWVRDLQCDEALVMLGFATASSTYNGRVRYSNEIYR